MYRENSYFNCDNFFTINLSMKKKIENQPIDCKRLCFLFVMIEKPNKGTHKFLEQWSPIHFQQNIIKIIHNIDDKIFTRNDIYYTSIAYKLDLLKFIYA